MTAELESQIDQWRGYVQRHQAIAATDVAEMEDHLRERIDELSASGLAPDEAFLVAVKRMGSVDAISREFAREHSDRLWKQLVLSPDSSATDASSVGLWAALAFAVGAAVAVKVAVETLAEEAIARNIALILLPFLTGLFAWKRRMPVRALAVLGAGFLAGALVINLYPFDHLDDGYVVLPATELLAIVHLPVVLWFVAGFAYVGGQWRSSPRRMDFIRFTGEWVVYMALLALGGIVLTGLTVGSFHALGLDIEEIIGLWIVPCGAAGAVVVAAWLVEAKQDVVENIAPVLTRVFTPLTVLMLVAVLIAFAAKHNVLEVSRDLLTLIDLILILVLGLLLYAISARDPLAPSDWFDRLQLGLVVVALAVDAVLLVTMLSRIVDAGLTANKAAALGLNVVLLVNLLWSARLSLGFVRGRTPFASLENWQTTYLPVYAAWAALVVVALPPIFRFA